MINFKTVLLTLDKPNVNNRTYPRLIAEQLIAQFNDKPAYGRFPLSEVETQDVLDMKDVSHTVSNLTIVNDELIGEVDILDTPAGKKLAELIRTYMVEQIEQEIISSLVGFGPTGIGNVTTQGVVQDYKLVAFDGWLVKLTPHPVN